MLSGVGERRVVVPPKRREVTHPPFKENAMLTMACPKCGSQMETGRYDATSDRVNMKCPVCGYEMTAKPLDRQKKEAETPQRQQLND